MPKFKHPRVETVPAASLIPNPKNARLHSSKQISQLSVLIKKFGWLVPIIIDDNNIIVSGHGRLLAAKKLGQTDIPVIPEPQDYVDSLLAKSNRRGKKKIAAIIEKEGHWRSPEYRYDFPK